MSFVCHVSGCVFSACEESSGGKWFYGWCHAWRYRHGRHYAYGHGGRYAYDEPNDDGPDVTSSHDGAAAHDVTAAPYDGPSATDVDASAHDDASANHGSTTTDASAAGSTEPLDAAAAHDGSRGLKRKMTWTMMTSLIKVTVKKIILIFQHLTVRVSFHNCLGQSSIQRYVWGPGISFFRF